MSATVNSLPLSAFSIGIRGSDVTDISGYRAHLAKLASNESNAYEITSINSLQAKLNDIADVVSIENEYSYSCNLTVTIPGPGNGTKVRFTFDNVNDASQSMLYIEGTFNLNNRSLSNITYKGFSTHPGPTASGVVEGIFVTYTFNNLQKTDNTELSTRYMKEWTSDSGQSNWQTNSEFNNSNDATTVVTQTVSKKSGVIYLVLDYSTSIGYQSSTMKSAAKNFIRTLQQKSDDPYSVSSISLNKSSLTIALGSSRKLIATVNPSTALDKSLGSARIMATTVDGGMTATCIVTVVETNPNGHDYVDLGLSSGLKWATMNIGSTKPEEFGDYFAWGETEPKDTYSWSTYKWCMGSLTTLTKYCFMSSSGYNGFTDNKTTLDPGDDAAHAKWGGSWRIPSDAELTELREECSWIWTSFNGVKGQMVIGPNGNSVFLPAAGRNTKTGLTEEGVRGHYWSSSLISETPTGAWRVDFDSNTVNRRGNYVRCLGFTIRPVTY